MRLPLGFPACASLVAVSLAVAGTAVAEDALPVNTVACLTIKDVKNYHTYTQTAPDFAKDLLDRATCFINQTPMPAVNMGSQKGYTRYKLLSGHKVWVANTVPVAK